MTAPVLDVMRPETATAVGAELETTTAQLVQRLEARVVTTEEELRAAVLDRQELGAQAGTIVRYFHDPKTSAYRLWKLLCDREKALLAPIEQVDRVIRDAIAAFKRAQDALRVEQEQAAQVLERQRREAVALHEAAFLEHAGEHTIAEALIAEAVAAPPPVVVLPDVTKRVEGLKFVRRWHARVVNAALVPREYLLVDDKKIGAYARAMKGSGAIAGVEFYFVDDPVR